MNPDDDSSHPLAPLRRPRPRSDEDDVASGSTAAEAERRSARRQAAVLVGLLILAVLLAGAWFVVPVLSGTAASTGAGARGRPAASGAVVRGTPRNGEIPEADLVGIGGGFRLVAPAAQAYQGLASALRAAGLAFTVTSAYRSREEQEAMVERYGLLEDGGRAAPVGESEHGLGIAVDLRMGFDVVEWLREHAADHGFAETISGEPWHWAYVGPGAAVGADE